ncbi:hypothetical protein AMJ44_06850 [candidate division WOR-1 bacterium DG_54_3]|uniref:Uncharacterized protein n=1 Tax=candidate division WOR-1 bacterium DG_54_3 TaxID=1703775 RepID=A0A0S7Y160_UNCSA|nr:MAG: hypothetical protein AMJ44_06850 [candidate division WOR-1 bacterium DG_54_3]
MNLKGGLRSVQIFNAASSIPSDSIPKFTSSYSNLIWRHFIGILSIHFCDEPKLINKLGLK